MPSDSKEKGKTARRHLYKFKSNYIPPCHSHPMTPITVGMKSKLLSLAYETYGIWPKPTFQLHHTILPLTHPTKLALHSHLWIFALALSTAWNSFSLAVVGSVSRFWLKCHILRGPPWVKTWGGGTNISPGLNSLHGTLNSRIFSCLLNLFIAHLSLSENELQEKWDFVYLAHYFSSIF